MKRSLRRFILWTSASPLVHVYRAIYLVVIQLTVALIRRYRSVLAIYLCRGCGKNDFTPGVSDIDFVIVTKNDSTEMQSIRNTLSTISRLTAGLLEYFPRLVQTQAELEERWRELPIWQYRIREGKTSWKLMHGTDVLSTLVPLTEAQRVGTCFAEMNRWWLLFVAQAAKDSREPVMENVVCYKVVSELLNLDWALQTGEYASDRNTGLGRLNSPLTKKLREIAAKRFLPVDNHLMDETFSFLLRFFADQYGGSNFHSEISRRISVVKSALWDSKDSLLIVDLDPQRLISVRKINALLRKWRKIGDQKLFLFLRHESRLFPLTPEIPRDFQRGVLTPASAPDIFLQLGSKERQLARTIG